MKFVHHAMSVFAPHRWRVRCVVGLSVVAAGLAGMQPGFCADSDSSVAMIVTDNLAASRTRQVNGLLVTPEVSTVRSRLAPSSPQPLTLDGRPMSELAGMNYKVWMSHGRADVGVGVGTLGYVVPRPDGRVDGPVSLSGASPTVSVGVRYRVTPRSALYADASGAHGLGIDPNLNYVNTKVGLEWKPAKQTFGFEHGAVGMHFDSGYRLSLKARHGGLGVYLRGEF